MKAVIFALTMLLGLDLIVYGGVHVHGLGATLSAFGRGIGAWVSYAG